MTCEKCRHFDCYITEGCSKQGFCLRYPPTISCNDDYTGQWATVSGRHKACGEFDDEGMQSLATQVTEAITELEEARTTLYEMMIDGKLDLKVMNQVSEAIFRVTHP